MAKQYLDTHGVDLLWGKIKTTFSNKKTTSDELTKLGKSITKLDGTVTENKKDTESEITSINKKQSSLSNEFYRVKDEILETGETSDTFVHVEDSAMAEMQELEVDGVCEQVTTTGKNLINIEDYNKSSPLTILSINNREIKFTTDSGVTFEQTIFFRHVALKANKTYTVIRTKSKGIPTTMGMLELYDGATWKKVILHGSKNSDTFTVDKDGVYLIRVKLANANQDGYTGIISNIMISEVGGDYEPYTGGQPSPSPDYPQDIKTITDSLSVTSCGKNILNNTTKYPKLSRGVTVTFENQTYILNGTVSGTFTNVTDNINFSIPLGTYKISVDSPKNFNINLKLTYEDGSATDVCIVKNESYKVFTLTKKIKFMYVFISALTDGQVLNDVQFKFQLMKNSSDSDSSVEDYIQSQITANLPEGEFIGKIDDTYKDTLSVDLQDDGKYHLVLNKNIGKRILNSGNMSSRIVLNTGDILYRTMKIIDTSIDKVFIILCNRYVGIEKPANRKDGNIYWNSINMTIDIIDDRTNITTIDEFKTWLSTHNVEVYYLLKTPYIIDLGVVDMPLSYDDITNIFTDSDLLPKINAKYYRNFTSTIQNLQVNNKALKQELVDINNRLDALESASASVVSDEPAEESEVIEQ